MLRSVTITSLVFGLSVSQCGDAFSRALSPDLRLVRAHTREPWVSELPVDVDMDGKDEILLVSDHTKGGHETSFIQLHTADDVFIDGPWLPGGTIQSVHSADLNGDGSRELIILVRRHRQTILVIGTGGDGETTRSIDLNEDEEISVLLIEDLDGLYPLDFILAVTGSKDQRFFRIIGYDWHSDRILWDTGLPGTFGNRVLPARPPSGRVFLIPYTSPDTTGVHLISGEGEITGHLILSPRSTGAAHLSLIEQPFGESLVITSVSVRTPRGHQTEISLWNISHLERIARRTVSGMTEPAMACREPGASSVVMGAGTGSLKFYDQNLDEIYQYRISTRNVKLKDVVDLDQDGVCEIISVSGDSIFCFFPETKQCLSFPARDDYHIIRQGFGFRPLVSVRDGRTYHYLRAGLSENTGPGGMAFTPLEISCIVIAFIVAGTIVGVSFGFGSSVARIKRLFIYSTTAYTLVDKKNRIVWSNDTFRTWLSDHQPRRSASKTANQTTRVFIDPVHGTVRIREKDLLTTGEFREWWGGGRILMTVTDPTHETDHILQEAWARAVREITARMRDALSTIRLGTQGIAARRLYNEKQSAHRERLRILLRETKELQELTTLLANAAALSEKDHEKVCPISLLRESAAHLPPHATSRIHIHGVGPVPLITAGKRQLGYALQFLLSSLASAKRDDVEIDISIVHETRAPADDTVRITMRCSPGGEIRVPVYVNALVHAVVLSCGGDMEMQTAHEEDRIIELLFPVSDSR